MTVCVNSCFVFYNDLSLGSTHIYILLIGSAGPQHAATTVSTVQGVSAQGYDVHALKPPHNHYKE